MKRQTRRNRYEKHRPIQLPKERPVQSTNKLTNTVDWYAEWFINHRTQEQVVEMDKWVFRFMSQLSPEHASQFRRVCDEYYSSPNTNIEKQEYYDKAFTSSLSHEERSTLLGWFTQWLFDYQTKSSVDV